MSNVNTMPHQNKIIILYAHFSEPLMPVKTTSQNETQMSIRCVLYVNQLIYFTKKND